MSTANGIRLESADGQIHRIAVGEFNIGRGWLSCEDKRVSRSHGTLKVYEDNSISLTSIHVNPLYYKIKDTVPLKILNKGNETSLHIGDTFGLLPDVFWFKIQAEQMPTENLPTSNSQDENTEEIGDIVDKLPDPDTLTASQNETLPDPVKNMDMNSEKENGGSGTGTKRKLPAWMTGNKKMKAAGSAVATCDSPNVEKVARNSPTSVNNNENKDEDMTIDVSNQLENTSMDVDGPTSSSVTNSINERVDDAVQIRQIDAVAIEVAVPEVALDVVDNVPGGTLEVPVRVKQEPTDDALSNVRVKTEVKDDPDENAPSTSTSKDDSTQTDDQKVKIKKEKDDCGNGVSSTSTSSRESCRYGVRCYRRNQVHREEEAHPGDSDYRRPRYEDPPIGTPPCPYGSGCYRRNPDHFRMFSHPSSTNPSVNRRMRKAKKVVSSDPTEDDEDHDDDEDPFATDDSGSEYDPEKASSSEDDEQEIEPNDLFMPE